MSSNYPAGLTDNTPNCPWSEHTNEPQDFDCITTETLQKHVLVPTSNYREFCDRDEDGGTDHWFEFDNVDWTDEYENNNDTLPEILNKCHFALGKVKDLLLEYKENGCLKEGVDMVLLSQIEKLIDDTEGWELVEREVELDE